MPQGRRCAGRYSPGQPTLRDEPVGQAVQQDQIGLRPDGVMLGRDHGRLRLPRIDDNDFGPVFVPTDPRGFSEAAL
jgi:hypothetical protein